VLICIFGMVQSLWSYFYAIMCSGCTRGTVPFFFACDHKICFEMDYKSTLNLKVCSIKKN